MPGVQKTKCHTSSANFMTMKNKAPPKGQRPISSFLFKRSEKPNDLELAQVEASQPSTSQPVKFQDPPVKRPEVAPRQPAKPLDPVAAHARWQAKLVGEEDGGIVPNRVRTQDGVHLQAGGKGKLTPLEEQVVRLQARHSDCVLAVECGYKYRFFGRDAEIAAEVLRIFAYPDHSFLTAGVPTARIDWHIRRLVAAGHKVGVVRQTETAAIKAKGDNRSKPFERELAAVYTRATLEAGELAAPGRFASAAETSEGAGDAAAEGGPSVQDGAWSNEQRSAYLVCVIEGDSSGILKCAVALGVVAVETSTGDVLFSQFVDSSMRPELESRLMYVMPSELLVVQPVSTPTQRLLASYGSSSAGIRTEAVAGSKYRDGGALAAVTAFYGGSSADANNAAALDAVLALPPLVLQALAHALDYLQPFGLAEVLRLGPSFREFSAAKELALSPNTLQQLEILRNCDDGGEKGSLLWLMDRTLTAPGARLMRHWVSRPLRDMADIVERLDAVEELLQQGGGHPCLVRLPGVLRGLPDLERALTRALHRTSSPAEFVTVLRTFKDLHAQLGLGADLEAAAAESSQGRPAALHVAVPGVCSPLLFRLLQAAADLRCASVAIEMLACLDEEAAAAGDKLRLFADDERFAAVAARRADVAAAERGLQELRPTLAAALNVRSVEYVNLQNQGEYLVEVAVDIEKRAPKDWERISSTKKYVRFRPPAVKRALAELEVATEHLAATAAAAWTRLLGQFGEHYGAFRAAGQALAALDCLNSFAALANSSGYVRPEFVPDNAPPQLHITAGRHPVLDVLLESSFVPNDTFLGGGADAERCAVITGPNMGGKSCLIRQAALIACMAQAGSFVPAKAARLHAFDAIFTRMGAADNIALGRSTFLEELGETSTILATATARSLVIIDELGRGTSTLDGVAIAQATLVHIVQSVRCLTLFVTHYPEVTALERQVRGTLGCYFMAYVAESERSGSQSGVQDAANGTAARSDGGGAASVECGAASVPKVTFLYRLTRGVAQASFGLNVARMAGLPEGVVRRAAAKAAEIQASECARGGDERALEELAVAARAGLEAVVGGERGEAELRRLQRQIAGALLRRNVPCSN